MFVQKLLMSLCICTSIQDFDCIGLISFSIRKLRFNAIFHLQVRTNSMDFVLFEVIIVDDFCIPIVQYLQTFVNGS